MDMRSTHQRQPGITAKPLGELAHGQSLIFRQVNGALAAGVTCIGLGDFRQRAFGVEPGSVGADRDRERGDGAFVVDAAIEQRTLFASLFIRIADDNEAAGQDLDQLGITAGFDHAPPDVAGECLSFCKGAGRCKDRLGGLSGELAARIRSAGLDDHRPALHRTANVERTADVEILATVGPAHEAAQDRRKCRLRRRGRKRRRPSCPRGP